MARQKTMNRDELLQLVDGGEWNEVEFKEARRAVPRSAYETVSAFANAHGGWLVFGVGEIPDGYQIVGVENVDRVQNDFLAPHAFEPHAGRAVDPL